MIVTPGLVARLEASEAWLVGSTVAGRAGTEQWWPDAGGVLVSAGDGRHASRAIGVAGADVGAEDVADWTAWFRGRGLVPRVQVSAHAGAVAAALGRAGYLPGWSRVVLVEELASSATPEPPTPLLVRPMEDGDLTVFVDVYRAAFASDETAGELRARVQRERRLPGRHHLLALDADGACSVGSCVVDGDRGVAWLGWAGTLPGRRRRGGQTAVVHARRAIARAAGARWLAATAATGSDSDRNLQRLGLGIATHQWVWEHDGAVAGEGVPC